MNKRNIHISRAWTATVKYRPDTLGGQRVLTTTIHGSNPPDAEANYKREHPDVVEIIIRSEQSA